MHKRLQGSTINATGYTTANFRIIKHGPNYIVESTDHRYVHTSCTSPPWDIFTYAHALSNPDNCRFLFPDTDPVTIYRWNPASSIGQGFVIDKSTTFSPLDFEATGALLVGKPGKSNKQTFYSDLLDISAILVDRKIKKHSKQAADVAAAVEKSFAALKVSDELYPVQVRLREELKKRAYQKLQAAEAQGESKISKTVDALLARLDRDQWARAEDVRQKTDHVRRVEAENVKMAEQLAERKDAHRFSGEYAGILEILEEEAQRDGEIMSEEQWIATIRPHQAFESAAWAHEGSLEEMTDTLAGDELDEGLEGDAKPATVDLPKGVAFEPVAREPATKVDNSQGQPLGGNAKDHAVANTKSAPVDPDNL